MRKPLGFLLALVALYLLTGVVQVRRGERAVVRRFGRVLDVVPEPGLWVGLPWGMDRVDRIEVDTMRSVTVGYVEEGGGDAMPVGQLLTGDHNLVNVQVIVYYKVRLDEITAYAIQADAVRDILARAAEAVVAGWVASRTVDDVLLTGKTALRNELTDGVNWSRIAGYGLGIDILDSRVSQDRAPPDDRARRLRQCEPRPDENIHPPQPGRAGGRRTPPPGPRGQLPNRAGLHRVGPRDEGGRPSGGRARLPGPLAPVRTGEGKEPEVPRPALAGGARQALRQAPRQREHRSSRPPPGGRRPRPVDGPADAPEVTTLV